MMVLITYDVNTETNEGKRRLRQVAKQCVNYGQRVQNSVFECSVDEAQLVKLRTLLCGIINPQSDSLRFYLLGNHYANRIQHFGVKAGYDPNGTLII